MRERTWDRGGAMAPVQYLATALIKREKDNNLNLKKDQCQYQLCSLILKSIKALIISMNPLYPSSVPSSLSSPCKVAFFFCITFNVSRFLKGKIHRHIIDQLLLFFISSMNEDCKYRKVSK